MNGIAATMLGNLSVTPAFQEGLYTPERHLFYLAMQTFIYKYRRLIGMLNAYAEPFYPFYPVTVENSRDRDMKEKPNGRKNKKGLKKQSEVTKPTDIETRSEETIKPVLQQREEVINKQSTEEWKKVESKKKKKTVTNNKEERNKTQNENKYRYNILAEDDKDEE